MYSKIHYSIVGFFIFSFTIALIFFAFWLGNRGDENGYKKYLLRMSESVIGLSQDSSIKMKGVNIGVVESISINPDNIEEVDILIKIEKNIPIKEDMRGVVKMYGLTGLSYIEIDGGSNGSKLLIKKDNQKYPIIKSTSSLMGRLEGDLGLFSTRFMSILQKSEELLSKENINNFSTILSSINQMAKKTLLLEDELIYTLQDTRAFIKDTNNSLTTVKNRLDIDLIPLITNFINASKSTQNMVNRFDSSIKRGDYNLNRILQPMITDIRVLTTQIEDLSIMLERSPSDILFKSSKLKKGPGE